MIVQFFKLFRMVWYEIITVTGSTLRLTFAHKGGRNLCDDPLSAGIPSYVMQEEFSRYQGYWWQPKCVGESLKYLIIILKHQCVIHIN